MCVFNYMTHTCELQENLKAVCVLKLSKHAIVMIIL